MSWVVAVKDFSWKPTMNTTVDFKEGEKYNMPKEAADKLIEEGKVKPTSASNKKGANTTGAVEDAIEASSGNPELGPGSASSATADSIGANKGKGV
jgi:hypothetical protein